MRGADIVTGSYLKSGKRELQREGAARAMAMGAKATLHLVRLAELRALRLRTLIQNDKWPRSTSSHSDSIDVNDEEWLKISWNLL
jgi:hypothetical protein